MGHLLDAQYALGIREVNYGPTVDVALIREKMPDALIKGHLPPFTLRNGSPEAIKTRIIEDFHKAGESGGLEVTTAGSLAAGTGVGRMRWFMLVVQEHCCYAAVTTLYLHSSRRQQRIDEGARRIARLAGGDKTRPVRLSEAYRPLSLSRFLFNSDVTL